MRGMLFSKKMQGLAIMATYSLVKLFSLLLWCRVASPWKPPHFSCFLLPLVPVVGTFATNVIHCGMTCDAPHGQKGRIKFFEEWAGPYAKLVFPQCVFTLLLDVYNSLILSVEIRNNLSYVSWQRILAKNNLLLSSFGFPFVMYSKSSKDTHSCSLLIFFL